MSVRGSFPGGNQLDRYGRWIAIAGIALLVSGRLSHSGGVVLVGLAIAVGGIGLGLRAARSTMQIYVQELIPGGTNQRDPFLGQPNAVPSDGSAEPHRTYVGTVVWAGGIGKAVRLELSSRGLSIESTWLSGLLLSKRPAWTLSWSTVRSVEVATIAGTGSGPSPVKFSVREPSTVFLFFCRTPTVLRDEAARLRNTQGGEA